MLVLQSPVQVLVCDLVPGPHELEHALQVDQVLQKDGTPDKWMMRV